MMRSIAGFRVIHETQKAKGKITVTIANRQFQRSIPIGLLTNTINRMAARRASALLLIDSNALLSGISTDKDIATRFIACEIDFMNTPVSKAMIKNSIYVLSDTLAVEALQKMVQVRHLPVVENGEVIALLDIAKCLYDAIARTERAAEKGKAIVVAVEGWGLFEQIKGLIKDLDGDDNYEMGEADLKEAQNSFARLIQMLYNDDPREVLKRDICVIFSYVYYVGFADYTYGEEAYYEWRTQAASLHNPFTYIQCSQDSYNGFSLYLTIEVLSMVPAPDLSLRLYLECAEAANDCDLEPLGYVVNETLRILIFLRVNEEVTFFFFNVVQLGMSLSTQEKLMVPLFYNLF
ncbi:hypothetical protein LXL04_014673 [Taraxacum kok-saghyz]